MYPDPFKKETFFSPGILVFFLAFLVRMIFHLLGFEDYWGDSYHSIIISELTVENNWIYDDYKGREVVWLPTYRYLATAFMFLFNRYDLLVPHFLNMILGSVSCVIVYLVVHHEIKDREVAKTSGFILALLPWHVAFSHMNMSECLCGLFMISSVYAIQKGFTSLLFFLVFFGVLIRNEMSFLYLILLGGLIAKRHFKLCLVVVSAAISSLCLWASWCYFKTGDPFWWISTRIYGSTKDAAFNGAGATSRPIWIIFSSLIQAFPLALVLIIYRKHQKTAKSWMLKTIVYGHWILLFLMQFKFFSHPDAHYFIITLPLASALFGIVLYHHKKAIKTGLVVAICSFFILLPTFYFLPYTNIHAQKIGEYISDRGLSNHVFLNDFPVAYYYAKIDIENNFSTDQALAFERHEVNHDLVHSFILEKNISYVVAQEVSFSNTFRIWPQMQKNSLFKWKGMTFTPVHTFEGIYPDQDVINKFRTIAASNRGAATLWRIDQ